jgi:hypothetical protein
MNYSKVFLIFTNTKVYIGAINKRQRSNACKDESLLKLVEPYLVILADYWHLVIADYAFLSLPNGMFNNFFGCF